MPLNWRDHFQALGVRATGKLGYAPVLQGDLDELVRRAGCGALPSAYVELVTTLGNACFTKDVVLAARTGAVLKVFAFLGAMTRTAPGVISRHDVLSNEYGFPPYLIPIADDGLGQPFLLDGRTPQGQIYYCQIETGNGELELVAESFDSFVEHLREREAT